MAYKDIYPLTIISDRYGGTYSGALFLAFNVDHYDMPQPVGGCDPDEMCFFQDEKSEKYDTHHNYLIGKGNTPQEAFDNLYKLMYSEQ